jgi:hypothetical protein
MKRTTIALCLLTVFAFGAVTWVEDTAYRNVTGTVVYSGRRIVGPDDSLPLLTLPYYPWTQLWAYALLESIPGHPRGQAALVQVQWRWGTYDAYAKTHFYFGAWNQALPSIWVGSSPGDSMVVFDSLYLGPLYDSLVPLAWVDRIQLRVMGDTDTDSLLIHLWVRRRTFEEAGPVLQWPPWGFGFPK